MKEKLLELIIEKQDEIIGMYLFPDKGKGYIDLIEHTEKWINLTNELTELKSRLAEIKDKDICKFCGQEMSCKSEPEYICMNPECDCYCKTDKARKATMKDLTDSDEAKERGTPDKK